jgi:hypothetical protein
LDQRNGTLGTGATNTLFKGFNPTNPRRGSAIVATFYWFGSTNIITSVFDHLTDGTPVGNTYNLVEYVTAGGISMATYLATNIQNFPDPNPNQEKVLVVRANLSMTITDGGLMITAYSGVHPDAVQALGERRSASGMGSAPTTIGPGSIAVGAGALVHGVVLSDRVVGHDPPVGFTNITTMSSTTLKTDGEYDDVPSVGTSDPRWTWYFQPEAPGSWLASVLAQSCQPRSRHGQRNRNGEHDRLSPRPRRLRRDGGWCESGDRRQRQRDLHWCRIG